MLFMGYSLCQNNQRESLDQPGNLFSGSPYKRFNYGVQGEIGWKIGVELRAARESLDILAPAERRQSGNSTGIPEFCVLRTQLCWSPAISRPEGGLAWIGLRSADAVITHALSLSLHIWQGACQQQRAPGIAKPLLFVRDKSGHMQNPGLRLPVFFAPIFRPQRADRYPGLPHLGFAHLPQFRFQLFLIVRGAIGYQNNLGLFAVSDPLV